MKAKIFYYNAIIMCAYMLLLNTYHKWNGFLYYLGITTNLCLAMYFIYFTTKGVKNEN